MAVSGSLPPRPGSSPSVPAQAPAAIAALDEAQARQLSQAPQHGIEVHPGLDGDGGGPGTAAGGQGVEHPGAVGVEVVTGDPIAVTEYPAVVTREHAIVAEEHAVVPGQPTLALRPGVRVRTAAGGQRARAAARREKPRDSGARG